MAKNRFVNTRFWNDSYISNLDPIEKLLFLYFITNEHTSICGIYEIPLKIIAIETGIDKEMIEKMIRKLEGKIHYIDGWIYIKNFPRYQIANDSVKKGIEVAMKQIPEKILTKINQIQTDCPQTVTDSRHSVSNYNYNSNLNSNVNINNNTIAVSPEKTAKEKQDHQDIIAVFDVFKTINPTIQYGNKTNRKAASDLIKQFGLEKVKNMALYCIHCFGQPYAPVITTPYQLQEKMGQLVAYKSRSSNKILNLDT